MRARVLPVLLLGLAACSLSIDYSGSSFRCDDGACPDGFVCSSALLCVSLTDAADATAAGCRNGIVEAGEQCDDGNDIDTDACRNSCAWATCGDGVVRTDVEECDDGNNANGDSCSATCQRCAGGVTSDDNGHCYVWPSGVIDWHAAVDSCAGLGGYLASLTDGNEVLFASTHAPGFPYWIGLDDIAVEGTYVWYDGEPQAGAAIPWLPGQPNGGNDNNDCIWAESSGFNDLGCTTGTTARVLCEIDGWHVHAADGHAYRFVFVPGTAGTLASACADLGGQLATLDSSGEAAFLGGFATGSFWVGPAASSGTCNTVELSTGGGASSTAACTSTRFGVCEIE
jgi:cysteine-rich repeat protein